MEEIFGFLFFMAATIVTAWPSIRMGKEKADKLVLVVWDTGVPALSHELVRQARYHTVGLAIFILGTGYSVALIIFR